MIIADLSELEYIADILRVGSNGLDDTLNKAKSAFEEMSVDTEFAGYPQAQQCLQKMGEAIQTLSVVNERLCELKNIMLFVPSEYSDREREYKNELSRMTSYLGLLNTTATAVLSPDYPFVTGEKTVTDQAELQKMVEGSAEELRITNIAAVSKIIEKDYPVKKVREI